MLFPKKPEKEIYKANGGEKVKSKRSRIPSKLHKELFLVHLIFCIWKRAAALEGLIAWVSSS